MFKSLNLPLPLYNLYLNTNKSTVSCESNCQLIIVAVLTVLSVSVLLFFLVIHCTSNCRLLRISFGLCDMYNIQNAKISIILKTALVVVTVHSHVI